MATFTPRLHRVHQRHGRRNRPAAGRALGVAGAHAGTAALHAGLHQHRGPDGAP